MLDIAVRPNDTSDVQVIILAGEFHLDDQNRVENLLFEVLTDNIRGIVFDLTAVTYMEEAGYSTLVFYLQEAVRNGVHMAVVARPQSILMKKLDRMGFIDVGLNIFSSGAEAERAIKEMR